MAARQSELEAALTERARALVPVLRDRAEETNRMRRIPDETIADLWDAGLLDLLKPKKFGGQEIRYDAFLDLSIELGRGDGSAAWVFAVINVHDLLIALYPEEAQREIWDKPRTLTSSSFMAGGKAEPDGGGYRVSGKWSFCSGVDNCEWILLGGMFGMVGDPPHPDIRFMLLPLADCQVIDDWHVYGLRGTGSKSVAVENAFVPEHRVLGFGAFASGQTPGSAVHDGPIYRAPMWAVFPFCVTSPATGIARGALDAYLEQMKSRSSVFGNAPMSEMRAIQMRLAEASALIDAAELLYKRSLHETIEKIETGVELSMEHRVRSRRDQGYSVVMAMKGVELLFRSTGGKGLYDSSPVQRAHRDVDAVGAHVAAAWDLTSAMYGQVMLGGPPTDPFY